MNIRGKVFLAIFISSSLLAGAVTVIGFSLAKQRSIEDYRSRYRLLANTIANTILELEATIDLLGASAAELVKDRIAERGVPSNKELHDLATRLNVSRLYVIDKSGAFIRDSDDKVDAHTRPLFDYCQDYQQLVTGNMNAATTPIVPSYPFFGAYKFRMVPSLDRSMIIEVGMNLGFIGEILQHVLASDANILSVGLFTPSGTALGYFSKDKTEWQVSQQTHHRVSEGKFDLTDEKAIFIQKLRPRVQDCCECKQKNILDDKGEFYYVLRTEVAFAPLKKSIRTALLVSGLSLITALILALILASYLSRLLLHRINSIDAGVKKIMSSGDMGLRLPVSGKDEATALAQNFNQMLATLHEQQRKLITSERDKSLAKIASQVAHDVRSPLAALDTLLTYAPNIEENSRITLRTATQRIHDIANNLLQHYRNQETPRPATSNPQKTNLLMVVESLVSEKRAQFNQHRDIEIKVHAGEQAYLLFFDFDASDLRRSLSNIIDNAFEALEHARPSTKIIYVEVSVHPKGCKVSVRDTGIGMHPDRVQEVLNGDKIASDKVRGHGLGLAYVRESLSAWQGSLEISSQKLSGTQITLIFPRTFIPDWYAPGLIFEHSDSLFVIDDDPSIHEVWRQRLIGTGLSSQDMNSLADFACFLEQKHQKKNRYFVDFEFARDQQSGLDFIIRHGIQAQSILVTSHADELRITGICQEQKLKLIPKSNVPSVPLLVRRPDEESFQCILFDDNVFVRGAWQIAAGKQAVRFHAVKSYSELIAILPRTTPETSFYIDHQLDSNFTGLEIAFILYQMGVQNVYLTTGLDKTAFAQDAWLKGIVGKTPPF